MRSAATPTGAERPPRPTCWASSRSSTPPPRPPAMSPSTAACSSSRTRSGSTRPTNRRRPISSFSTSRARTSPRSVDASASSAPHMPARARRLPGTATDDHFDTPTAGLVALVGLVRWRSSSPSSGGTAPAGLCWRCPDRLPGRGGHCGQRSSRSPPSWASPQRSRSSAARPLAWPASTPRHWSPSTPRGRWTRRRRRSPTCASTGPAGSRCGFGVRSPMSPPASPRSRTARFRCCSRPPIATRSPPSSEVPRYRAPTGSSEQHDHLELRRSGTLPARGYFRRGARSGCS